MFLSARKGDKIYGQITTGVVQSTSRGPLGGRYASVLWENGKLNPKVNLKGNVWPSEKAREKDLRCLCHCCNKGRDSLCSCSCCSE